MTAATAPLPNAGAIDMYPTFGCALFQRHCPLKTVVGAKPGTGNSEGGGDPGDGGGGEDDDDDGGGGGGGGLLTAEQSYSGVFFDEHEGSAGNESRCLGRALDFLYWCGSPGGAAAGGSHVTAVYGVSGSTIAVMPKTEPGKHQPLDFEYHKGSVSSARLGSPAVAGTRHSRGCRCVASCSLTTASNRLQPPRHRVQRPHPNPHPIPGAVSSALFSVATAYAACQSPPLPATSDSGMQYYNCHSRHSEMAVEAMDQHLLYSPEDANAWFNRGVAMYQLTRLEEAAASFTRALELDPDHASGLAALATIMTQLGGFSKARALLEPRLRSSATASAGAGADAETGTGSGAGAGGARLAQDIIIWARLAPRFNETEAAIEALEELLANEANPDVDSPKVSE